MAAGMQHANEALPRPLRVLARAIMRVEACRGRQLFLSMWPAILDSDPQPNGFSLAETGGQHWHRGILIKKDGAGQDIAKEHLDRGIEQCCWMADLVRSPQPPEPAMAVGRG